VNAKRGGRRTGEARGNLVLLPKSTPSRKPSADPLEARDGAARSRKGESGKKNNEAETRRFFNMRSVYLPQRPRADKTAGKKDMRIEVRVGGKGSERSGTRKRRLRREKKMAGSAR